MLRKCHLPPARGKVWRIRLPNRAHGTTSFCGARRPGAPSACRDAPGGGPLFWRWLRWIFIGSAPGAPQTGAHGGGGLYGQGKDQPRIAARFIVSHVTGAAAPRAARIGITLQALKVAALYQLGPPGRRRCLASEILWRSWQLENGASRMPRPTSSAQATDRSLPGRPESSFPPLGLLSPRRPLRWVAAGAPIFTPAPSRGGVTT